jgi:hypothetical protein
MKVSKVFNANLPIGVIQEVSGHNLNCVRYFRAIYVAASQVEAALALLT